MSKKKKNFKLIMFKLFISFCIIVFILYFVFFSGFFNVVTVNISGASYTDEEYLAQRLEMFVGENIFLTNKNHLTDILMEEPYVKDITIRKKLPSELSVDIVERNEAILVIAGENRLILDYEAIILRRDEQLDTELFTIQSSHDVKAQPGKELEFIDYQVDFNLIADLVFYIKSKDYQFIEKITIDQSEVCARTEYGTIIKLDPNKDMKYQIVFTKEIINDRMNKNQSLNGQIDFTKSENPVFIDYSNMEVTVEE
ncbi:MAG: FtsQ-type POTRA domain-containing protein [Tissierellales bacterium]|nr:FtsQ-type POTRA domain-containing protein [Tissierellales bacterium]MBN2827663.1 FtsQ-type POTRA domain-containing protein [Tissierellales bacterium]